MKQKHGHSQRSVPANLENCIANESVLLSVQTHRDNGCKVTLVFSDTTDENIRRDVAQMLLAAFQRELEKECKK